VLDNFNRLRSLGFGLSIDDFGTGFSSLRYLDRFPITEIKIDRCFIKEIDIKSTKGIIIKAIVDLGEKLNVGVVAEGVETEWQRAQVVAIGCRYGQGYLFGRPMSQADFSQLIIPE
jgi:EAL domain-containing protein (putative c-di-GMP-specific phosphodiesterase class I)